MLLKEDKQCYKNGNKHEDYDIFMAHFSYGVDLEIKGYIRQSI